MRTCETCCRKNCTKRSLGKVCIRHSFGPQDEICIYFGPECEGLSKQTCGAWNGVCKCPQNQMNEYKEKAKLSMNLLKEALTDEGFNVVYNGLKVVINQINKLDFSCNWTTNEINLFVETLGNLNKLMEVAD